MIIMIGIIGAILVLVAWAFEAEESIRRHKNLVDLKFVTIYLAANILLAIYSYQINNLVFLLLQIALVCLVSFEILYTISVKKVHRRK